MGKKYNYEDAWEDLEQYYGDDVLETEDVNFDKDTLTYGEGDPAEYVKNIVFDIVDGDGITMKYEMVGRVDVHDRTYLILHRLSDTDESSVSIVRAWDDEAGELSIAEITDEAEFNEVMERVNLLLNDSATEWHEIPEGGVQWND